MKKIFFISGLGANELAFSKVGNVDFEKVMIKWIPCDKKEDLESYALRLIDGYKIKDNDIVVGLSFGGLLAQKISNITGQRNVILISSFRDKNDLRFPFRQALYAGLQKLFLPIRVPWVDELVANMLNSGTSDSKSVLKEMLKITDYRLMKWSLQQIATTNGLLNKDVVLYNIIGDRDRIVRLWKNDTTFLIKGGSHFMVYDRSEEVTKIIRHIVSSE
ncbi:MAG: alpha/beta hydrolase [Saprospiraceae bacterium]